MKLSRKTLTGIEWVIFQTASGRACCVLPAVVPGGDEGEGAGRITGTWDRRISRKSLKKSQHGVFIERHLMREALDMQ